MSGGCLRSQTRPYSSGSAPAFARLHADKTGTTGQMPWSFEVEVRARDKRALLSRTVPSRPLPHSISPLPRISSSRFIPSSNNRLSSALALRVSSSSSSPSSSTPS